MVKYRRRRYKQKGGFNSITPFRRLVVGAMPPTGTLVPIKRTKLKEI